MKFKIEIFDDKQDIEVILSELTFVDNFTYKREGGLNVHTIAEIEVETGEEDYYLLHRLEGSIEACGMNVKISIPNKKRVDVWIYGVCINDALEKVYTDKKDDNKKNELINKVLDEYWCDVVENFKDRNYESDLPF